MTNHASPHQKVIAAALEDWWITTDPAAPFDPATVAESVEQYLLSSGYYIAPDTGIPPMHTPISTTCGASRTNALGPLGPCVLRHRHDGPVHQDARGATWWTDRTPAPPSRASVLFTAFLTLVCITAGLIALARQDWYWATAGVLGATLLCWEVADELAERRTHRRRGTR
jgi:hypothetical protein